MLIIGTTCTAFSAVASAQGFNCGVPSEADSNGDGWDDNLVSPAAIIGSDSLIGCESTVGAGARVLYDSEVIYNSTVESDARVSRSTVFNSTVRSGARVQSSGLLDYSEIRAGSRLQDGSYADGQSIIDEGVRVHGALISQSFIGRDSLILPGAQVVGADLGERVTLFRGAWVLSNGNYRGSTVVEFGARIGEGAILLGPLSLLPNATIGSNTEVFGYEFIGENFHVGRDTKIRPGGDILGNVRMGSRVDLGAEHNLDSNTIIEDDVHISSEFTLGEDSLVRAGAFVDSRVDVGMRSTIGLRAIVGYKVVIGDDVMIGQDAQIGDEARIGDGAVILPGSVVPANAVVAAGSTY